MTLSQLIKQSTIILEKNGIEDAKYETQLLVENVFDYNHPAVIVHSNDEVCNAKIEELNILIKRRATHEPLQYILGKWNFFGFDFEVGTGVLIPRDDTEVVVNLCIDFLKSRSHRHIIDLCAGSGAISVALEKLVNAEVTSLELSDTAFEYLEKNIKLNNTKIKTLKGDVFKVHTNFENSNFDLIVSNPPYIISNEIKTLQSEVQQEPKMALDGGADGYDFYKAIIKNWSPKLKNGGALAFELGENQAEYVAELMTQNGFENIVTSNDLGGIQRAIIGTFVNK